MTASTTYLRAPRGLAGVICDGHRSALTMEQIRQAAPSVFQTKAHESRSERFGFVGTDKVLRAMIAEGFRPVSVRQGKSRIPGKADFTKHIIRLTHAQTEAYSRHGSDPEVILLNSHDGTSAYRLMSGVWRGACDNGMVVAESLIADLRVSHTIRAVQDVLERSMEIVARTKEVMNVVDRWSRTQMTTRNLLDFAEQAHALRFEEGSQAGRAVTPRNLLDIRREEDARLDLYTVFNVVQENIIRGGQAYRQERVYRNDRGDVTRRIHVDARVRPINSIDDDVTLNRNLWDLAARMEREIA